jgi:hypothetical protein
MRNEVFSKPRSGAIFVEENASQFTCRLIEMLKSRRSYMRVPQRCPAVPGKITNMKLRIRNYELKKIFASAPRLRSVYHRLSNRYPISKENPVGMKS